MYKIIACDLDETLLNSERKVSMKDRESIKKATALGVKFVLATGRGFPSVDGTLKEVDLFQKPDEYVISFNGGAITENLGNRLIDAELMDFDIVNQLFKRGWNYDVCIHFYTLDKVYVFRFYDGERKYVSGRMHTEERFENNIDIGQDFVFERGYELSAENRGGSFRYHRRHRCELFEQSIFGIQSQGSQ